MKKIIFLFTAIFIIGCNSNINQKRIIDNTVVYGKVKTITQTLYCVKEKFGEMEKTGYPSTSFSFFNEKTNLIKDSISDEISSIVTNYKYDNGNKIIEKLHFNYPKMQIDTVKNQTSSLNMSKSIEKYVYSNSNKKRKEIGQGKISVSHFDNQNRLIEYDEYKNDGSLSYSRNYSYDSKDNIIEEIISYFVSSITYNYTYDKRNNLIQKKVNGLINVNYSYQNFDSNGNWLKQNIEVINLKPNYGYNEFNIYGNWTELNFEGNTTYVNERKIEYYK
ncbi:hypothetical protein [Flavobacterium sp.]|jgi:hypothetical protein|uniref:hypothetical protein n=1 Tax=Flavobacterium sp. TaxID=239 RepID=UPI0037C0AF59